MCLELIEPTEEYADQIMDYRREFLEYDDSMDGTSCLREYDDVTDWLTFVRASKQEETDSAKSQQRESFTASNEWVPDEQYLCIRKSDNRLIGMIDIREKMNQECLLYYGNIGYSIRKSERKKGYAAEQLRLALELCLHKGMSKVLVTCDKNNTASAKTIIRNGGKLENEIFDPNDKTITQRYWIEL